MPTNPANPKREAARRYIDSLLQEVPPDEVRCLLCNKMVERPWFDVHMAEECHGAPLQVSDE
jgi:hypothetical protein